MTRLLYRRCGGFTLVEVLRALAIAAILLTWAAGGYADYVRFPESMDDILGAPGDPSGNAYQYLNTWTVKGKIPKDKNLVSLTTDYDVYSVGEDGRTTAPVTAKASHADIVRARSGGFIGLAVDY